MHIRDSTKAIVRSFVTTNSRMMMTGIIVLLIMVSAVSYFYRGLLPPAAPNETSEITPHVFEIKSGDGFWSISNRLSAKGLIRSRLVFELLSLITGSAMNLKPGLYKLSPAMSAPEILGYLIKGGRTDVEVTIPEGSSVYEIDKILSDKGVIPKSSLIEFSSSTPIEGKLFPDTYRLFTDSSVNEIVDRLVKNFEFKALPILNREPTNMTQNLILASLVQKEVPDFEDEKIVAGILKKRLAAGIPLQVDATICYLKKRFSLNFDKSCYPITDLDLKFDSSYNTYLYKGLPPGPISNPGSQSIAAVIEAERSPYWFYLSDPKTRKTVFSKTLEEHARNRFLYLNSAKNSGE